MLLPNGLDYLYSLVEGAVEYCNSMAKRIVFDPELIKSNFAEDLISLTAYSACADGKISQEEFKKMNHILEEFGYGLSDDKCHEMQKLVNENPFEIPKTLKILVTKAMENIENWKDMGYNMQKMITQNEMIQLGSAIIAYTNIMCFIIIEDKTSFLEKTIVSDCLEKCVDYVKSFLGEEFMAFCNYKQILDRVYKFNE